LYLLSNQNVENHLAILGALFCLSLDHYTHVLTPSSTQVSESATPKSLPPINSPAEVDAHLHNIRSGLNARNRWFDKAFTLIVESNTRAGAMGEHSPCDALVPSIAAEYAIVQDMEDVFPLKNLELTPEDQSLGTREGWRRLDWVVDDLMKKECQKVEEKAKVIINDSDDSVLWFTGYGTDWIKGVGLSLFHFVLLNSYPFTFFFDSHRKPISPLTHSFK